MYDGTVDPALWYSDAILARCDLPDCKDNRAKTLQGLMKPIESLVATIGDGEYGYSELHIACIRHLKARLDAELAKAQDDRKAELTARKLCVKHGKREAELRLPEHDPNSRAMWGIINCLERLRDAKLALAQMHGDDDATRAANREYASQLRELREAAEKAHKKNKSSDPTVPIQLRLLRCLLALHELRQR